MFQLLLHDTIECTNQSCKQINTYFSMSIFWSLDFFRSFNRYVATAVAIAVHLGRCGTQQDRSCRSRATAKVVSCCGIFGGQGITVIICTVPLLQTMTYLSGQYPASQDAHCYYSGSVANTVLFSIVYVWVSSSSSLYLFHSHNAVK